MPGNPLSVPSHALPPGPETRARRRARLRVGRRLPDWRTWVALLTPAVGLQLSDGIVSHFWPHAHGVGYVFTDIAVGVALGGALGAVLVAAVVIRAAAARDRRSQSSHQRSDPTDLPAGPGAGQPY